MFIGFIKSFNEEKGYGWIRHLDSTAADCFVHRSQLERGGIEEPYQSKRVTVEIGENPRTGRAQAEQIPA